jgi:hypothetical protein
MGQESFAQVEGPFGRRQELAAQGEEIGGGPGRSEEKSRLIAKEKARGRERQGRKGGEEGIRHQEARRGEARGG